MDLRMILRGLGKTFISAGTLILLFVAFQLWGTGISEAHAQTRLKREFLAPTTTVAPATTSTTAVAAPTTTLSPVPPPPTGTAVAIIKIPKISVNSAVVEGVGVDNLKQGPGHYPGTPMPGQAGNAAIAGHRTTYGAPFYRLDELKPGDMIYVTTRDGAYGYQVLTSTSVSPNDVGVLDDPKDGINRLTLTTCTPRFTATHRLVVVSKLIGAVDPHPPAPPPVASSGGVQQESLGAADAPVGSLSGQGASTSPAVAWGIVCALVWLAAWAIGWRFGKKWLVYVVATPVFLLCLYFFFENFARFVPANI